MDNLDEILGQILVPETNVIQQATQKLKEVFKDPNIVPALCQTIASSQAPQVRQFAAVLLRKKIAKEKQWSSLPPEVCQNIRDNILQILLQEPEKSVRNSVSLAVSIVAKHDLPENKWPQLFQFILQYTKSPDPGQREIGMFILYKVATVAAEQLKPHLISLLELLGEVINDEQNKMVPYYAIM